MLGLCWTPSAVQGMQKVASTMPSNPEQLLGAILVRRDIFQRFESTMNDTCLDANNLLEYLFSLYNSTAAPSERENFPSPQQVFRNVKRDTNHNKKGMVRNASNYSQHNSISTSINNRLQPQQQHHQQPTQLNRAQTARQHQIAGMENHQQRKKLKMDQGEIVYGQQVINPTKTFDGHPVFPGLGSIPNPNVKMEMAADMENTRANTQSSSPLPPFSQIRRQGTPYSPGASHFTDNVTPTTASLNFTLDSSLDSSVQSAKGTQENIRSQPPEDATTAGKTSEIVTSSGRKKVRRHQCFCGAWFTRADNLKRHVRKCHEEKLEKLSAQSSNVELSSEEMPSGQLNDMFSQGTELEVGSTSEPNQDKEQQQNENQLHHLQQQSQHQQQQHHHHHHPHQEQQQQQLHLSQEGGKGGMKWACFCGESFEDHRELVEHTRLHEGNT